MIFMTKKINISNNRTTQINKKKNNGRVNTKNCHQSNNNYINYDNSEINNNKINKLFIDFNKKYHNNNNKNNGNFS